MPVEDISDKIAEAKKWLGDRWLLAESAAVTRATSDFSAGVMGGGSHTEQDLSR